MRAAHAAPTYIRSGLDPVPRSLMRRREGKGSKGMGPILNRGVSQPCRAAVTHPPWNWQVLLVVVLLVVDEVLAPRPIGLRAVATLDELRATAPAFAEQARGLAARERFDEASEKLDPNYKPSTDTIVGESILTGFTAGLAFAVVIVGILVLF